MFFRVLAGITHDPITSGTILCIYSPQFSIGERVNSGIWILTVDLNSTEQGDPRLVWAVLAGAMTQAIFTLDELCGGVTGGDASHGESESDQ
jgi:hypothetical protein